MEIGMTKLSSKGQIVIPSPLRKGIRQGQEFIIIYHDGKYIISKADEKVAKDLEFAERTEKALEKYEKGLFKKQSFDDFKKDLADW